MKPLLTIRVLYNELVKRKRCSVAHTGHTVVLLAKGIPFACIRWDSEKNCYLSEELNLTKKVPFEKVVKLCEEEFYQTMSVWQMGKD